MYISDAIDEMDNLVIQRDYSEYHQRVQAVLREAQEIDFWLDTYASEEDCYETNH